MTKLKVSASDLIEEYNQGETLNTLAEKYGVSRQCIQQLFKRHGFKLRTRSYYVGEKSRRKNSKAVYESRWIELYNTGVEINDIAESFSVNRNTVYARLKMAGIRLRGKPKLYTSQAEQWKHEYIDLLLPLQQIASNHGCSAMTVRRYLLNDGVTMRGNGKIPKMK